jgi:hypothetical protein
VPAFNGGHDYVGIGGPSEGHWLFVVLNEEPVDGGLKIDDRMENAAFQTPLKFGSESRSLFSTPTTFTVSISNKTVSIEGKTFHGSKIEDASLLRT